MTQNSAHTGKLYVVGTPIGNLGDLSPRVGEAFAAADAICCEDTRVTSKLLMHLGISKPLVRRQRQMCIRDSRHAERVRSRPGSGRGGT